MSQPISNLPVGALVKDTTTKYYGSPIIWTIADKNHAGYPANSVTLLSKYILTLKCSDAKEPSNSNSDRQSYGNNRYQYSNIRQWLNSAAAAGAWYTAQHSADAPPTNANVWSNYNEYDAQAGFQNDFSANFRNALLSTSLTVVKASVDGGGTETVADKVFLLSTTEVGLADEGYAEGSKLALFSDNTSRLAYPTALCVSNSEYTSTSLKTDSPWYWWLRTPYASYAHLVRRVLSDGSLRNNNACNGYDGVRPACNLPSSILVSDSPDGDGAYTIVWNQPPTTPSSITVPTTVRGGQTLAISWGASTDPDGNLAGYRLERSVNGGAYSQIYQGTQLSYTDNITYGWTTVQYRVKAYDTAEAESGYQTSPSRTVINNTAPVISGSDGNLGTKSGDFSQTYTVTDAESDAVTVVEKIDGVQLRSYTVTLGATNTFSVSGLTFMKLLNGSHTLTVTATDSAGASSTRTWTFTKSVTSMSIVLSTPMATDAMVTKCIINVTRAIPAGANFKVEVCNNGFDASPTWEDCTSAVLGGRKFFLSNTTKTAAQWGFNVRVTVSRNGAIGDCYVSGIGGNFE
jgi:hypothetical protein